MALITLPYSTEAQLLSAWASIPDDVVASGNSYLLQQSKVEILLSSPLTLSGKNCGPSNNITIAAAPGASYTDSSTVSTTPFVYSATTGAAIRIQGANFKALLTVGVAYLTIRGMQLFQGAGDSENTIRTAEGGNNLTIDRCIIDSAGQLRFCWALGLYHPNSRVTSSLVVHRSNQETGVYIDGKTAVLENVTIIRPSNFTSGGSGVYVVTDGNTFRNCVALGFAEFVNMPNALGSQGTNNASSGTVNFGTNNKQNLVPANEVVSFLNDFRLKTGSSLINAGATPSDYNTQAPNGVRQQGTSADIGAWEFPDTLVAPSATVTAVSVTGQNVTISGTTTGVPTSGTASVTPTSIAYNSAVAAGPVAITFGSGTFTVTFTGLKVGEYNFQYQVANSGYTVNGQNTTGAFRIVGATATVTQDPMSGQVLRISGTVTGSPTSGQLIVPAAAMTPNGAFDQTKAVTITGSNYEVSISLPPGNYDAGILRFTNAAGTSLPQSGTSSVSVIGIDGNPEAPEDTVDPNAPTVSSVTVSPTTATGSTTFTATVIGNNLPSQSVTWTVTAGSINSGGLFTAPAATSSVQNITVTATSSVDPSKSGTASVTIAEAQVVTPPPTPTVTSVTVSPSTAMGSTTFSATIVGTNSPSQAVTWVASAGTITSGGAFTAPAATTFVQSITVTARSVLDTTKTGTATITIPSIVVIDPPVDPLPGGIITVGTVQCIKLPPSHLKLIRIAVT